MLLSTKRMYTHCKKWCSSWMCWVMEGVGEGYQRIISGLMQEDKMDWYVKMATGDLVNVVVTKGWSLVHTISSFVSQKRPVRSSLFFFSGSNGLYWSKCCLVKRTLHRIIFLTAFFSKVNSKKISRIYLEENTSNNATQENSVIPKNRNTNFNVATLHW